MSFTTEYLITLHDEEIMFHKMIDRWSCMFNDEREGWCGGEGWFQRPAHIDERRQHCWLCHNSFHRRSLLPEFFLESDCTLQKISMSVVTMLESSIRCIDHDAMV
ncbi:hypothetical protein TNCV_4059921 [Trichonephila clavipes]|nr:hypothetical protein TNCV_4059921 [Trichonephila clavipes]